MCDIADPDARRRDSDVNQDSYLDLLFSTGDGNIALATGKADGSFDDPIDLFDIGPQIDAVLYTHVDSDDRIDIFAAGFSSAGVHRLLHTAPYADNTWTQAEHYPDGTYVVEDFVEADVDDDGLVDVVFYDSFNQRVQWFRRGPNGLDDTPITVSSSVSGGVRLTAGDFNGDNAGVPDDVAIGTAATVRMWLSTNPVGEGITISFPDLYAGDVNGDGVDDIIMMAGAGSMMWVEGSDFQNPMDIIVAAGNVAGGVGAAAVADVTGDGAPDILVCIEPDEESDGSLEIFVNPNVDNLAGEVWQRVRLADQYITQTMVSCTAMKVADVDNNGSLDIVLIFGGEAAAFVMTLVAEPCPQAKKEGAGGASNTGVLAIVLGCVAGVIAMAGAAAVVVRSRRSGVPASRLKVPEELFKGGEPSVGAATEVKGSSRRARGSGGRRGSSGRRKNGRRSSSGARRVKKGVKATPVRQHVASDANLSAMQSIASEQAPFFPDRQL